MSTTIVFTGAKGGQGTTTVAATAAVLAAAHRATTLVTEAPGEAAALLGLPRPIGAEPVTVTPRLWVASHVVEGTDVVIGDGGERLDWPDATVYAVLRGPCYLALAALLERPGPMPDGIVLLAEKGRSLTARDVAEVSGVPVVATVPVTPAVAGTIDAGLLLTRLHRLPDLHPLRPLVTPRANERDHRDRPSPTHSRQPAHAPSRTGTDLPCPQCGHGGDRGYAGQTRREPGRRMHVYRSWSPRRWHDRAEHREARPWRRRVLHR